MVATVVVMSASTLAVTLVPNVLNLSHGFRLFAVHLLNQNAVHLFTVIHSLWCNLKGFVKKIVFTCDDVYKVSDASRCMIRTV